MTDVEAPDAEERPATALLPVAATCLAVAIVVVTLLGVLRLVTVPSGDETELKVWITIVVLLLGLTLATVVVTCAVLLRRGVAGAAEKAVLRTGTDGLPPPPPGAERAHEPDYVIGPGRPDPM